MKKIIFILFFVSLSCIVTTMADSDSYLITWNIPDDSAPGIFDLTNVSTTSSSSYIEWTTNESTNYSIRLYNITDDLIDTKTSNTFATDFSVQFTGLLNKSYYWINLTVWDIAGNSNYNDTFSFNTSQTALPGALPASQCNKNISTLQINFNTDRIYGRLCKWLNFK